MGPAHEAGNQPRRGAGAGARRVTGTGPPRRVRPSGELTGAERHRRLVAATIDGLRPGSIVSHFSAGLLLGLPIPLNQLERVWVIRDGPRGHGRVKGCVRLRHAPVDGAELVVAHGVVMTSLARTAVDVACRLDFGTGVAVVDAAMARGATRADLEDTLDRARGSAGIGRARTVVAFADPRSQSVGESRSRALMLEWGVPLPDLQHEITDDDDHQIARVDFWWKAKRLVGEFDGKVKYTRDLAPDGDVPRAVWEEKKREDKIRRRRCAVERWTWAELYRPRQWAARLLGALR